MTDVDVLERARKQYNGGGGGNDVFRLTAHEKAELDGWCARQYGMEWLQPSYGPIYGSLSQLGTHILHLINGSKKAIYQLFGMDLEVVDG